jgi:hypothetical protein
MNHVAVVGSAEIPWIPEKFVANPSSVTHIMKKMEDAIYCQSQVLDSLNYYNKSAQHIWKKFLISRR